MAEPILETLPTGVPEALARPDAHPEDPSAGGGVRWVQTHLSHVFLTAERVVKLRKAVDLGFVDFSTRALRNADCLREVALNRRLAPDVYLGIAPLLERAGRPCVGPVQEALSDPALEHAVVMRRLPDGRDALSLLVAGRLRARHVDAVAERIAAFHEAHRLGLPAPISAEAWRARLCGPVAETLQSLAEPPGAGFVARTTRARVERRAREFFERHASRFEARRVAGRAVDGHGDLHLQHVWFERDDAEPLFIDCLEFRDDLRQIDAAAEVAFLAMDLRYRGRSRFAERFLRRYAASTDDFDLYGVLAFFVSYRAAVRAKVAALAAADPGVARAQREAAAASARRHLALADRVLAPPGPGALVVVTGIVGTGKSSVAQILADELGGVVIGSDRVRKRMAGIAPTTRGPDAIYTASRSAQVYAGLLERAAPALDSGRVAILDATFDRAERREAALRWARARGVRFHAVETRCAERTVLDRLARRQAKGHDPSDAGPALYRQKAADYEPVRELPPDAHEVVRTDSAGWRSRTRALARRLRPEAGR